MVEGPLFLCYKKKSPISGSIGKFGAEGVYDEEILACMDCRSRRMVGL
jgi:hypothetical protein